MAGKQQFRVAGMYEKTEQLQQAFDEQHRLSNADLLFAHTLDPLVALKSRSEAGASAFSVSSAFEQVKNDVAEETEFQIGLTLQEFGDCTIEDLVELIEVEFGLVDETGWIVYVEDQHGVEFMEDWAGSKMVVDPIELARAAVTYCDWVVLNLIESDFYYVFKSDAVEFGKKILCRESAGHIEAAVVGEGEEETECWGLPNEIQEAARW